MIRSLKKIVGALIVLLGVVHSPVHAQQFPSKPVQLIVPFAPAGSADIIARIYAEALGKVWKQQVIVINRPGAGGNLAADFVAAAAPDGYTLLLAANSHVMNKALYTNVKYDPIKDFTPITEVAYYGLVLVVIPSMPVKTIAELVAYAKQNPGKLSFGSAGTGTPTHLAGELLLRTAGIDMVHVPYKGAAPATNDMLGGQIQLMFNNPISALPFVKSGQLRAVATSGNDRSVNLPDVKTVAEAGFPGFEAATWFALIGPANVPKDVVAKIAADVRTAVRTGDVTAKLAAQGVEARTTTPQELTAIMYKDQEKWTKLIRAANIKPE